jgi:hypothetical protein
MRKLPKLKVPKLNISKREAVRLAAPVVVLALIASVVTGREKPTVAVIEPAARIDSRVSAPVEDLDLSKLERPAAGPASADPFARLNLSPAAAAQGEAQAPAKPTAPPLPFKYLGKMIDGDKLAVFVSRGDETYTLHPGQKVDDAYRVDKVGEESVTFTYLPLKTKQELQFPAAN